MQTLQWLTSDAFVVVVDVDVASSSILTLSTKVSLKTDFDDSSSLEVNDAKLDPSSSLIDTPLSTLKWLSNLSTEFNTALHSSSSCDAFPDANATSKSFQWSSNELADDRLERSLLASQM